MCAIVFSAKNEFLQVKSKISIYVLKFFLWKISIVYFQWFRGKFLFFRGKFLLFRRQKIGDNFQFLKRVKYFRDKFFRGVIKSHLSWFYRNHFICWTSKSIETIKATKKNDKQEKLLWKCCVIKRSCSCINLKIDDIYVIKRNIGKENFTTWRH